MLKKQKILKFYVKNKKKNLILLLIKLKIKTKHLLRVLEIQLECLLIKEKKLVV